MQIYNTLTRTIEEIKPLNPPVLTMYTCGPTVYDYTHIGHIRTYVNIDILTKALKYRGYDVKNLMNITDVGHLANDNDEGEDKMEKGARKYGKTVQELATFYTDFFLDSMKEMNITLPPTLSKATEHIEQMIALIKDLQNKGHVYETKEAVYFDTTTYAEYGKLSRQKQEDKKEGVREEVVVDPEKKHPADFVLWFKCVGRFENHVLQWESPWGKGFPGWHIECSAMAMHYLGNSIDIHTGGIEHIPVHHENEIAQSEGATGKPFARYWIHGHHLQVDGEKMSKSLGNFYTIEDIKKRGFDPMAYRLLIMQTHYRQPMNFTWEALVSAQQAWDKLKEMIISLRKDTHRNILSEDKLSKIDYFQLKFNLALENDLQMSQAMSYVWELLKSNIPSEDKLDQLYEFDQVLGFGLRDIVEEVIPDDVKKLANQRIFARAEKDFALSDQLREEIEKLGYTVEDHAQGSTVRKKREYKIS